SAPSGAGWRRRWSTAAPCAPRTPAPASSRNTTPPASSRRAGPRGSTSSAISCWADDRQSPRDLDQLVDYPPPRRCRPLGKARPGAARQFADIDVSLGVDGDPVRRDELPGIDSGVRQAEPRQHLAVMRMDADPRPDIGPVAVDFALRPAFADIAQRIAAGFHPHAVGPVQVVPLGLPFAVAVEHLDAVVFAVGDVDPAVMRAADVVRDVE